MVNNCPYYEEHCGEYYQGMWQFTDCCYFINVLDTYNPHCGDNPNCWYKRKDCKNEIEQIQNKLVNVPSGFSIGEITNNKEDFYRNIIKTMLKELGVLQEEE